MATLVKPKKTKKINKIKNTSHDAEIEEEEIQTTAEPIAIETIEENISESIAPLTLSEELERVAESASTTNDTKNLISHECCISNEVLNDESTEPTAPPSAPPSELTPVCSKVLQYPDLQPLQLSNAAAEEHKSQIIYNKPQQRTSTGFALARGKLKPLTCEQRKEIYNCNDLQQAKQFELEFLTNTLLESIETDELYLALLNYYELQGKLTSNKHEVQKLRKYFLHSQKEIWEKKPKTRSFSTLCPEGSVLRATVTYDRIEVNQKNLQLIANCLSVLYNEVCHSHTTTLFGSAMGKESINKIVNDLLTYPIEPNAAISLHNHLDDNNLLEHVTKLRRAIAIMFSFIRRPSPNEDFARDLQKWMRVLVAQQLLLGSKEDHWFLLFNILRCPSGVGAWAAPFLQLPGMTMQSESNELPLSLNSPELNNCLAVLQILLLPAKKRNEFLKSHAQANKELTKDRWVVLDSDGEDAHTSTGDCVGLKESDVIDLLNQVPFERLFTSAMNIEKFLHDYIIEPDVIMGRQMLTTVVFLAQLVEIFGDGLLTYNNERYKQLSKRLTRLMRHSLQYAFDYHELFMHNNLAKQGDICERIEVELNALLLRACSYIYRTRNLSTWQYFSTLPYATMDTEVVWYIFYYLNVGFPSNLNDLIESPEEAYKAEEFWTHFNVANADVAAEDMYYLLQAFFEMTHGRDKGKDWTLIKTISLHIFHIGFVNSHTREFCYKTSRDLLANITLEYPELICCLLVVLKAHIGEIDRMPYLFKALPLDNWQPSGDSFEVLYNWLLHFDYKSRENMLARLIIGHLNWGFDNDNGQLFLPHNIHVRMACLIAETLSKHASEIVGQSTSGGFTEGVRNVMDTSTQSQREQFSNWCWTMVSMLRLHLMDQSAATVKRTLQNPTEPLHFIPELERIDPIWQGVSEHRPIAIYVGVLISLHGHSIPLICQHGFELLFQLVNNQRYAVVIRCLEMIIPLFLETPETLAYCENFQKVLRALVNADKTYIKMAKEMVYTTGVGPVLEQLDNMLHRQIVSYTSYGLYSPLNLINVWLNCFTASPDWNNNSHMLHLLDKILCIAYQFADCRVQAVEFFYNYCKDFTEWKMPAKTSVIKAFFGGGQQSRLPQLSPHYCWLQLVLLEIEFRLQDTSFWPELLRQLTHQSLETALKKTLTLRKQSASVFPAQQLVMFKFATLISEMDVKHPLFPIMNQKFFELYLWRVSIDGANPQSFQSCGVADKFYEYNVPLMKRIKTQLKSAEMHYAEQAKQKASDEGIAYFYRSCTKLMQNCALWLEDTGINKYSSEVEQQLPPQYNSEKLRELLSGQVAHWTEYLNATDIRNEQRNQSDKWAQKHFRLRKEPSGGQRNPLQPKPQLTPSQRIKTHLSSYDNGQSAPQHICRDQKKLYKVDGTTLKSMCNNMKQLVSTANEFNYKSSELNSINSNYLELEPKLYEMIPDERMVSKQCTSLLHRNCNAPVQVKVTQEYIKRNDEIYRKINTNRECHNKLVDNLMKLDAEAFASHAVELSELVSYVLRDANEKDSKKTGITFFYHVVENLTSVTMKFQPTQKLFEQMLESLGNFIVCNQSEEGLALLKLALRREDLVKQLATVFCPCQTGPETFLVLYQFLIDSHLQRRDPKIIFVLLSKFDLLSWLGKFQPKLGVINQLLLIVLQGLESWSLSPEQSSLLQDQFRCQLVHIYEHDFPQHYGEVLQLVLDRISDQKLMAVVLLDLLNALFKRGGNCTTTLTMDSNDQEVDELTMEFARRQKLFTLRAATETCALLARHFQKERLHHGLHGLYPKHLVYCKPLTMWFTTFGHVVLATSICTYQELLADQISDNVFAAIVDLFGPWLIPYNEQTAALQGAANWIRQLNAPSKQCMLPWSESHVQSSKQMIGCFVRLLQYILQFLPASHKILEHVFAWYVHHFAVPRMAGHVLAPLHEGLAQLPWERFRPQVAQVQQLFDALHQYVPESHAMLGHIFIRIDWDSWFAEQSPQAPIISRLFTIFVKLAFEPNIHVHPNTSMILENAIQYPWHLVEYNELENLLKWFTANVEPIIILKLPMESNYADRAVLDLLRLSCGMIPEYSSASNPVSQATAKRLLYTRFFVRLQRACAAKHAKLLINKDNHRAFVSGFMELLDSISAALVSVTVDLRTTDEQQQREAINLMLEIIAPTQSQSEEVSNLHINSLARWQENCEPGNPMVRAPLFAIGQLNMFIGCIYALLESSIANYFRLTSEATATTAPTWRGLIDALQLSLPKLELMPVLQGNYYFSFHVYVLYKFEEIKTAGEQVTFLQDVTQLLEELKTTPQTEPRLALVWGVIIARGCRLLSTSEFIKKPLCMLARHLQIASTKAEGWSDNLLGAIGLKTEIITNKRKVLTRCLACVIFSLFPANRGLRIPSEEYESGMRELSMLLANKKFNDIKAQIVRAVTILNEQKIPEPRDIPHVICRLIDVFYEQSYLTTLPEIWDIEFKLN